MVSGRASVVDATKPRFNLRLCKIVCCEIAARRSASRRKGPRDRVKQRSPRMVGPRPSLRDPSHQGCDRLEPTPLRLTRLGKVLYSRASVRTTGQRVAGRNSAPIGSHTFFVARVVSDHAFEQEPVVHAIHGFIRHGE